MSRMVFLFIQMNCYKKYCRRKVNPFSKFSQRNLSKQVSFDEIDNTAEFIIREIIEKNK